MDMFEKIVAWNQERGLIEKGFNHEKEASFIIEELLESTGVIESEEAREESEEISEKVITHTPLDKTIIVDALADIIVYATGGIAKLGYNPSKVMDEVYKEINSRTGKLIDGKFVKDPNVKKYEADFTICKY
ncbi:MAG: hypothetical protein MRY57_03310 [Candidatus Pacebacteria bacterium]|nr:hypothetical protein [Candidatus Paceibacterota bacterium]